MDTAVASEDELEVLRGQVDSSAEYWEALIARGYLPQAWADDPRRRFQCWYCRGRPPHYEPRDCTVCQNQGYLPAPAVRQEMVHVARQWRKMLEAEALFAEGLAGLQRLGLDVPPPALTQVRWIGRKGNLWLTRDAPLVVAKCVSGDQLPRAKTNSLRAAGFPPPWQITLTTEGDVLAGIARRGGVPMTIAVPSLQNAALRRVRDPLGFGVRKFENGIVELLYPC